MIITSEPGISPNYPSQPSLNEEPDITQPPHGLCFPVKEEAGVGVRQHWYKVLVVSLQNDDTTLSDTQPWECILMKTYLLGVNRQ